MKNIACVLVALALLAGCRGGGSEGPRLPPGTGSPPSSPPTSGIGPAGGTVNGPAGARVVVPAGALSQNVQIAITQSGAGAPALPAGVTAVGDVFAFTPHGTAFAVPVSVTVPYNAAALPPGAEPRLYKTGAAQAAWEPVPIRSDDSTSVSADVVGFSYFVVATQPPLTRGVPERAWQFQAFLADGLEAVTPPDQNDEPNSQIGGTVDDEHDFGALPLQVGGDQRATGAVFSNETGTTYWVFAQGPAGSILTPTSTIGNRVTLVQKQRFKKNSADARLTLHVTRVFVEAIDANGSEILYPECPWTLDCGLVITGSVMFDVRAYGINTFFSGRSRIELSGHQGNWRGKNQVVIDARQPLWGDDFVIDGDVGDNGSKQHARYQLKQPITIEIPIPASVQINDSFTLLVEAVAETVNRRQRESYVAAYFRDPVGIEGTVIETFGLEPVADPVGEPPIDRPVAPECNSGPDPTAGTLQFDAPAFFSPEIPQGRGQIVITRSGDSRGAVSATISSRDESALAGVDYQAVDASVYFGDGDVEPRIIEVPIVLDRVAEPDKRLNLTLSEPRGCATLGTQATATLTILDDDRPESSPPAEHTIGGTVTGLRGSGLVLRDVISGSELMPGEGAFTFARAQADGSMYDVRVITHPTQPIQECTVTRGSGTIAGADITNIAVSCVTPSVSATLDPSFGQGGRVSTDLLPSGGRALALQGDGRILALGRQELARFNTNGSLDTSFGTGGIVPIAFNGVFGEEARDIAVQPDGRIVVVGYTRAGPTVSDYDFAVARYNSDGSQDTSFGNAGRVTIDFYGQVDRAHRVVIQSDGRIVVGGHRGFRSEPPLAELSNAFAVVRLNTDGSIDTTFNFTGKATALGGFAYALALDPGGKILLGGRTEASEPAAGLARWHADGSPDTSEDDDPDSYVGLDGEGQGSAHLDNTDIVQDVLIDDEGRIFAALQSTFGGRLSFMLAELSTPFGNQIGRPAPFSVTRVQPLGPNDDIVWALTRQPDGKLIVVGQASSATAVSDFGIARFNADRSIDTTFDSDGVLTVDFFGGADGASDVAVQPDGKILVLGSARNGATNGLGLVRILP